MRLLLWAVAFAAAARPAHAVVPGLAGPLQALAAILPQILAVLAGLFATMLSVPMWKQRLLKLVSVPRKHPVLTVVCLGLGGWGGHVMLSQTAVQVIGDAGAATSSATWPTFRGSVARLGTADDVPIKSKPAVLWTYKPGGTSVTDFSSSPAVVGDRVYLGSAQASVFASGGAVLCLNAGTGKRIWQTPTAQQVFSSPSVVEGRVYVGEGLHQDSGSKLYCLDARTGKVIWRFPTKSHLESTPAVVGGKVVFTAGEDGAYCLDAKSGKRIWQRPGMHADLSPAVAGNRVYLGTGYGRTQAMCLDLATGKVLWRKDQDLPVWGPPAVAGDKVYFGMGNGDFTKSDPQPKGRVVCLTVAKGDEVWRYDVPDAVLTAVALKGGLALAGSRDGKVYALAADTGKPKWQATAGAPVLGSPAVCAGHVYAVGGDGSVRAFSVASGSEVWSVPKVSPAGFLSSPALAKGRLFVGSPKSAFLCLGAK